MAELYDDICDVFQSNMYFETYDHHMGQDENPFGIRTERENSVLTQGGKIYRRCFIRTHEKVTET